MQTTTLTLPVDPAYNFSSTLNAHGWVGLAPNAYDPDRPSFSRMEALPSGAAAALKISSVRQDGKQEILISVKTPGTLTAADRQYVLTAVRHMLRLDEDFSEFYGLCRRKGGVWAQVCAGSGHLLRSPSVFEDMVKVLLTTNIQWGGTKRMASELVQVYGQPFEKDSAQKTFPNFAAIAAVPLEDFQCSVKLGYRAAYVHGLAGQFARGELTPGDFLSPELPTEAVRKMILSIKGFGAYAAASMLMLLGRYDHLPVDSVFQQFVSRKYFTERLYNLPEALAIYTDWGKWQYLAYWWDMLAYEDY